MSKEKILKELIIMVKRKNYNGWYGLGTRTETSESKSQRSKDIRAFLVDLFGEEEEEVRELLHILEDEINTNVYGADEE